MRHLLICCTFYAILCLSVLPLTSTAQASKSNAFKVEVTPNTLVKDSFGKRIPYETFSKQLTQGTHTLDAMRDEKGQITHYRLRNIKAGESNRQTSVQQADMKKFPRPAVGTQLPDFNFTDLNGNAHRLKDYRGKVVVLMYWFSVCKPCINEMPAMNLLAEKYKKNKDVVFIAPNWEKKEVIAAYMKTQPIQYMVCAEANEAIDKAGVKVYPTHLVLDRNGKVTASYAGGLNGIEILLEKDIEKTLNP